MNFVVKNEHWDPALDKALFGDWDGNVEPIEYVDTTVDMYDLLVRVGAFPSKGQARKNWKQTGKDVPPGFNQWVIGKLLKELCVWNPVPDPDDTP